MPTTSSRNPGVQAIINEEGDAAARQFVGNHYGFDATDMSWPAIDDKAEEIQELRNEVWRKTSK